MLNQTEPLKQKNEIKDKIKKMFFKNIDKEQIKQLTH
jgi:hypothetical protein